MRGPRFVQVTQLLDEAGEQTAVRTINAAFVTGAAARPEGGTVLSLAVPLPGCGKLTSLDGGFSVWIMAVEEPPAWIDKMLGAAPRDCAAGLCDYTTYLAQRDGRAYDLSHEAYHQAEALLSAHLATCQAQANGRISPCPACTVGYTRLRQ